MVQVLFYHLNRSKVQEALPKLLEKTLEQSKRAVVITETDKEIEALNEYLWVYKAESWLPHGSYRDLFPENQPIFLTKSPPIKNGASYLFLINGAVLESIEEFQRCFILFDKNNSEAIQSARDLWLIYKEKKYDVTYWQEARSGGWDRLEESTATTG